MVEFFLLVISILVIVLLIHLYDSQKKLKILVNTGAMPEGPHWNKFKKEASVQTKGNSDESFAAVLLDIMDFPSFIEDYGCKTGWKLLDLITEEIKKTGTQTMVYKEPEGNFFIFIKEKSNEEVIGKIKKVIELVNQKRETLKIKDPLAFSFGIYRLESQKEELIEIFEKVKAANIEAKKNEKNRWFIHTDAFRKELDQEKKIKDQMEEALENGEFELYLQPKYNLHTNSYCGAEALARWNNKEDGIMYPDAFIPIFERTGFISRLDIYMVEEACKVLLKWKTEWFPYLSISVNISRQDLLEDDFITKVIALTEKYGIDKNRLELELKESCIFDGPELMIENGNLLKTHGFEISMDDFGSSCAFSDLLEKLPLDIVKIDQAFFKENLESNRRFLVTKSAIDLVKKLEMVVVAKGIETKEAVKILKEIKCDIVQGYYYGKPMPVKEFEKHILCAEKIV